MPLFITLHGLDIKRDCQTVIYNKPSAYTAVQMINGCLLMLYFRKLSVHLLQQLFIDDVNNGSRSWRLSRNNQSQSYWYFLFRPAPSVSTSDLDRGDSDRLPHPHIINVSFCSYYLSGSNIEHVAT